MRKELLFTAEELLLDERFLAWVDSLGNDTDNQRINSLILHSPAQEDEVVDAVLMHKAIRLKQVPAQGVQHQKERLLLQLDRLEGQVGQKKISKSIPVAILLVAVLVGLVWWNPSSLREGNEKILSSSAEGRTLSDGTLIKLAPNSTITLSPRFEKASRREVWLKGEVEFAVQKKKSKKPFVVHMDLFDVEVTGTVFQAINLPQKASVLLREGSVQLIFKDGRRLRMAPGDFYAYSRPVVTGTEQPVVLQEAPILEKKIVFEDLPIAEVARQIEKRYPVKILIASTELSVRRITGILPNDNLDVLINALQIATESTSKQQGSTIVFTPQ